MADKQKIDGNDPQRTAVYGSDKITYLTIRADLAKAAMSVAAEWAEDLSTETLSKVLGIEPIKWNYMTNWPMVVAKMSVVIADALIAELNK